MIHFFELIDFARKSAPLTSETKILAVFFHEFEYLEPPQCAFFCAISLVISIAHCASFEVSYDVEIRIEEPSPDEETCLEITVASSSFQGGGCRLA